MKDYGIFYDTPLSMSKASILSLVPSLTELLFDLGLGAQVAGRTRFCIHPKDRVSEIPIIGGTKNPSLDKIRALKPSLIIANREENRREDVEALQDECEVLITDIKTIEDALLAISEIGIACGAVAEAETLVNQIRNELDRTPDLPTKKTAYLIWREPWMSVGRDTYIHSVMEQWNLKNIFSDRFRYPETSLAELEALQPDLILLSSEPYPFREKHLKEVASVCRKSEVRLTDGEWFSWYGSRMVTSFRSLNGEINRL